jgi:hypothetical protein
MKHQISEPKVTVNDGRYVLAGNVLRKPGYKRFNIGDVTSIRQRPLLCPSRYLARKLIARPPIVSEPDSSPIDLMKFRQGLRKRTINPHHARLA